MWMHACSRSARTKTCRVTSFDARGRMFAPMLAVIQPRPTWRGFFMPVTSKSSGIGVSCLCRREPIRGAYRQVTKVNKSYRLACASGITCIACSKCLFLNIFSHLITLQFGAKSLISLKNFVATLLMNMVFLLQWKKVQISGGKCLLLRFAECLAVHQSGKSIRVPRCLIAQSRCEGSAFRADPAS